MFSFFQFQIESPLPASHFLFFHFVKQPTSFHTTSRWASAGVATRPQQETDTPDLPTPQPPPPQRLRSVSSFTWEAGLWVSAAVMEARSQRGRPHLSLTSGGERGGVGSRRGRGVPPQGQSPPQSPPPPHTHTARWPFDLCY